MAQASQLEPVRILIVIVNYRTPGLTIDCLRTLAPEIPSVPGTRVVVVENGSGDDSAQRIAEERDKNGYGAWLDLVVSQKNHGFAGGNNLGIAHREPAEFVLLLNSDTLVRPGCLARCLAVMREHPEAGAMSCRVLNRDGSIQNVTRRFPSPAIVTCGAFGLPWRLPRWFGWADTDDLLWDREHEARDVDWLGGAFLFVRSAALEGTVRLDEDFFFYGEDVAFSHRLHRLGWTRRYDPVAEIVHLGGASSDPSRMPTTTRSVHHWRGRYLVQEKCYGRWASEWLRFLDRSLGGLRIVRETVRGEAGRTKLEALRAQLAMIRATRE